MGRVGESESRKAGKKAQGYTRRRVLGGIGAAAGAALWSYDLTGAAWRLSGAQELVATMAIDLTVEPPTLDPALVYDVDGWSLIHAIYDAPVQLGAGGALEMVLAESMTQTDPLIWEIRLRPGITFHNGEPLDVASIAFSIARILDPETASQVAGTFGAIEEVEEVDPLTARLHLATPAPWLPSQIAPWLALLPPVYASDAANDFANNPVGTGPYRFQKWDRGSRIILARNDDYFGGGAKGVPIADEVEYRFVLDGTTRVTDLMAGSSQLVAGVPFDEWDAVAETAEVIAQPIVGCAFVRIPTDVAPFDNAAVRLAMNHAVDVDGIITALLGGHGQRLANVFPPQGMGFDEQLAPHAYDPGLARSLLADAGYADGISTRLAYTSVDRADIVGAIAGQLAEVGIVADLEPVEITTFNATWTDPEAAPLRYLTWRPLFDPYTLLSLVVSNAGFLSRYDDPEAQELIDAGAAETEPEERTRIYQQLGRVLHDSPAGIYLWNRTSFYGLSREVSAWTPRPDDWMLPLVVEDES
ncbi:MAG: ABC transporter substrate-binding protein [Chloroflexia bacterium]|nr:ABC transporter substrate-binding protein [Chloroflexia bacterium]